VASQKIMVWSFYCMWLLHVFGRARFQFSFYFDTILVFSQILLL
jgi:hypothetical protein